MAHINDTWFIFMAIGFIFCSVSHLSCRIRSLQNVKPVAMKIPYFFSYKTEFFFLPEQSQKSRSLLYDGSRSLGLFRKGKTCVIAKFQRDDLVICRHSGERKTPSDSRKINGKLV